MRAVLIGSSGLVLGREYPLDASVVTIGRRDENMIVIKDPTVSRKHAEIRREGDELVISDKGSTSGITVNGQVIAGPHSLRDGDRIGIGSSAVFLIQMQPVEDKTITFGQQYSEQGRTQFITRDLGDPRAAASNAQSSPAQDGPRPGETMIQQSPFAASAPPPPSPRPAPANPAPAMPSFAPPPAAPSNQGWGDSPRAQQSAPDFAPPRPSVDLGGPPLAPPTMPDMPLSRPEVDLPRGMGQPPAAPDFSPRFDAPPPPPGGNLPPISAVTEFAPNNPSNPSNPMIGNQAPQFGNQPQFGGSPQFGNQPPQFGGPPQFDNQPPQFGSQPPQFGGPAPQFGNAPQGGPAPMMAPPPPPANASARGGRPGLVIALVAVVILVLIAAVVVGLLLTGKLG